MSSKRRSEEELLLAIDLGTTSCKVALIDRGGHIQALARAESELLHPRPNWAEADPEQWWTCVSRLTAEVLNRGEAAASQVQAVGLSGLMHALVPVDSTGRPLDRVMLWMDQRCQAECQALIQEHGERIRAWGLPLPRTTTSAAKLYWLRRHRPAVVQEAAWFLLPKDFLRFRLTGVPGTDPSDAAGTAMVSPRSPERWAVEYVEQTLGVSAAKLPPIRPSTELAGTVTESAAAATGLRSGTPVAVGVSDVRATVLGANLFTPGRLCLYLGTAAWAAVGLGSDGDALEARFLGATATFGASLRWAVQTLLGDRPGAEAYETAAQLAQTIPEGSEGVLLLPHLMGERGPYTCPTARGVFYGLTLRHRPAHLIRAVLEGTAYQIRHLLEDRGEEHVQETWCLGGGARMKLWIQILSAVMGRKLVVPAVPEGGLLGAAMTAAVGIGWFPDLREAARAWVRPDRIVWAPRRSVYEQGYRLYRRLETAMEPFFFEREEKETLSGEGG